MTRDEKGKFVKGHENVGAGRKPKSVEQRYLAAFKKCVTLEDMEEIINRALIGAKRGDPADRKFICDYLIGPPVEKTQNEDTHDVTIRILYGKKDA